MLIFIPGIAKLSVIDRDEAHFAQASRQMLQTGNFFQVRYQDKTRFQKPPGINWLQASSVKLFSTANATAIWPYRIPSFLGALFSILLTYFLSRYLAGELAARLAAAFLATSLLLVVEAHMAVIDSSLLFSVLLMQTALWMIYRDGTTNIKSHWCWALGFWLAMTYGLVLKGVTPLIGLLSIITLSAIERRISWLRGLHILVGLTLFIVLSLIWIIPINEAENSNYILQMINKDLLPKLQGGHESHGKPPLFHLLILPITFWPASLFLWQGGIFAIQNRHKKSVKFLLAWILPTWLFFEIMPTKLPQYVLPTFPALAIFCGLALSEPIKFKMPGKGLRILQIVWGILSIGLAAAITSLPYLLMQEWTFVALSLFLIITLFTVIGVYYAWYGNYHRAAYTLILMALISYPLIFTSLLPQLKPLWITNNITEVIDKNKFSSEKPLLAVDFQEPSLVFKFNTQNVKFTDRGTAALLINSDNSRIALMEAKTFDNSKQLYKNPLILTSLKGFNYSKGRWLELVLVSRSSGENEHVTF